MHQLFFVVPAGTNFLLGRAKSCQWQVFVRRRPPKQGELRTDVSKATMWGETRAEKGFNFVCAKLLFCVLIRGLQNLRTPCKGNGFWYFLRRAKSTAKTRRGLRPSGLPGTIQISARYEISAEMTSVHQVTGRAGNCNLPGYRR